MSCRTLLFQEGTNTVLLEEQAMKIRLKIKGRFSKSLRCAVSLCTAPYDTEKRMWIKRCFDMAGCQSRGTQQSQHRLQRRRELFWT